MSEQSQTNVDDNIITLKDVILKIHECYREVVKNWLTVLLIALPLVLYMLYRATFMINEDEGGGMGGIGDILGTFGFSSGASEYNLDKVLYLSRTRKIIQESLFDSLDNDFIANHLIKAYDFHESWDEDTTGFKDFLFTHNDFESFNNIENIVLMSLHGIIIGNPKEGIDGIFTSQIDDATGIMAFTVQGPSEKLSIATVKSIYENLSRFYVDKTIEKQKHTFDLTKSKVDSLLIKLNHYQYQYLKFQDTNRGLRLKQYEDRKVKLNRDIQVLTMAYGEALKNQEIADFALKTKTPFIQPIDFPIGPLRASKNIRTYVRRVVIGFILGSFLGVLFVLSRKIYREVMD